MGVECCGSKVVLRRFTLEWGQPTYSYPAPPGWRGKCRTCGAYLCKFGHQVNGKEAAWVTSLDRDGLPWRFALCTEDDCRLFLTEWHRLSRELAAKDVLDYGEVRTRLRAASAVRRGTWQGLLLAELARAT
jgi:hypothetical protein